MDAGLQTAMLAPAAPLVAVFRWMLALNAAAAWAEATVRRWTVGGMPPALADEQTAFSGIEHVQTLVQAKADWNRLASSELTARLQRLTPAEREAWYDSLDYFELAGLRLRQATLSGDAQYLADALGSLELGNTSFRLATGRTLEPERS